METPLPLSEPARWSNRRPLFIRLGLVALAVTLLMAVVLGRRAKTPDELEIELVSRLTRLSHAVMARDGRRIASLLDDAFTDEAGRGKARAVAVLTASRATPPIGYRPDREIYTLSPDGHSATVKHTVRIFTNAPRTHRVVAADITIITDWVLTDSGWLLRHTHRPVTRAVPLRLPGRKARV